MSSHAASQDAPAADRAPRTPRRPSPLDLRLAPARSTPHRPVAAAGALVVGILAVVAFAALIALLILLGLPF